MSKPFDSSELLARVKAHLRRNRMLKGPSNVLAENNMLCFTGLKIDTDNYTVEVNGEEVILAPKEFQVLELLARNPNKVFSNEELFQSLWGTDSMGDYGSYQ